MKSYMPLGDLSEPTVISGINKMFKTGHVLKEIRKDSGEFVFVFEIANHPPVREVSPEEFARLCG